MLHMFAVLLFSDSCSIVPFVPKTAMAEQIITLCADYLSWQSDSARVLPHARALAEVFGLQGGDGSCCLECRS